VHVVAIHRLRGNEELLARELAALLGKTLAEARGRVRVAASGPAVVGNFAQAAPAETMVNDLASHGFDILPLSSADVEAAATREEVSHVALGPRGIVGTIAKGSVELPYERLELILSGTATAVERTSVVTRERRFSPTRALLSGGLILHARTSSSKKVEKETRERFLLLQPVGGGPPWSLRERSLVFGELGVPKAASSAGNLAVLAAELRARCPTAIYDDRLENRLVQRQILGTLLPDRHLDIAVALVMSSLRITRAAS
jgi:hypothetical protein